VYLIINFGRYCKLPTVPSPFWYDSHNCGADEHRIRQRVEGVDTCRDVIFTVDVVYDI